jgi:DNA-directed RNA polymerase subunit M/transcription elongation factor TFIIS
MVYGVLLLENGNIEDIKLTLKSNQAQKAANMLIKGKFANDLVKTKGTGAIKEITTWKIEDDQFLMSFGYEKGKTKNTHELPPFKNGNETKSYYGDIIMLKVNNKKQLIDLCGDDYEEYYRILFETCVESDEEMSESEDDIIEEEEDIEIEGEDIEIDDEDLEDDLYGDIEGEETDVDTEIDLEDENTVDESIINTNLEDEDDDIDLQEDIDCSLNEYRISIVGLFTKVFDEEIAGNLEESLFNYICEKSFERKIIRKWDNQFFRKMYFNKARSLYTNLDENSYVKNTYLISQINSGEIEIEKIPYMNYQEMFPEHWKRLLDEKYKREKLLYEEKMEAMTDQFKCGRCKSKKCTYYELQTRSADEAMTTFISCLNCGNRWKQ